MATYRWTVEIALSEELINDGIPPLKELLQEALEDRLEAQTGEVIINIVREPRID